MPEDIGTATPEDASISQEVMDTTREEDQISNEMTQVTDVKEDLLHQ